jgi:hypothetical protein
MTLVDWVRRKICEYSFKRKKEKKYYEKTQFGQNGPNLLFRLYKLISLF